MVTDHTGMLQRIRLTALVISYALFPPGMKNAGYNRNTAAEPSSGLSVVSDENIRFCLADLNRTLNPHGELRLLFPGCFALAAPVLLFRLKREGFSDCRVLMAEKGLLLCATR
jgi:hypothetical protein